MPDQNGLAQIGRRDHSQENWGNSHQVITYDTYPTSASIHSQIYVTVTGLT